MKTLVLFCSLCLCIIHVDGGHFPQHEFAYPSQAILQGEGVKFAQKTKRFIVELSKQPPPQIQHLSKITSPVKVVAVASVAKLLLAAVTVVPFIALFWCKPSPSQFAMIATVKFTTSESVHLKVPAPAAEDASQAFPLLDVQQPYSHISPGVCDSCATDPVVRGQWVDLLLGQLPNHQRCVWQTAERCPLPEASNLLTHYVRWEEAYQEFLDGAKWTPGVTLLQMVEEKERLLQKYEVRDLFRALKEVENAAALALFPLLRDELDAHFMAEGPQAGLQLAIECALAGNLFDAGAAAAVSSVASDAGACPDAAPADSVARTFNLARMRCARPKEGWRYDDFDAVAECAASQLWRRAVVFCDNAGADVLGMLLLARQLVQCGYRDGVDLRVALAANSSPALNDITAPELIHFVNSAAQCDSALAWMLETQRIVCLPSGQGTTLLDLSRCGRAMNTWVAKELCTVGPEGWLVVLDGMGRSLESNWVAGRYFLPGVDVLTVAMIKSEINAQRLEAKVYDCVVRLHRMEL